MTKLPSSKDRRPAHRADPCTHKVWKYLGSGQHICALCGDSGIWPSVPHGAVLLDHDCEICRRNARPITLAEIARLNDDQALQIVRLARMPSGGDAA